MSEDKRTIPFHYIKSNYFRVIHADGAVGGITPNGGVFFSIWSQRSPIPKLIVHEISDDGALGEAQQRETKDGLVREVEVGIAMSMDTAKQLTEWLTKKIELAEKVKETRESKKQEGIPK
jgi:hypothetical protein